MDEIDTVAMVGTEREVEQSALAALAFDPTLQEARSLLIDWYVESYQRFLNAGSPGIARWYSRRALELGGPGVLDRTIRHATVNVTSSPAGAAAYLFRFEERKRRLLPLPCNASGMAREIEIPSVDPLPLDAPEEEKRRVREGSAYPLSCDADNAVSFPMRLPLGSYMVLLKNPGYADVRYPVLLENEDPVEVSVKLPRPSSIPAGFVYVPAGTYVHGQDPEAVRLLVDEREEGRKRCGAYLMARFPVSAGEYLDYLNDRRFHTIEDARKRLPRTADGTPYWETTEEGFRLAGHSRDEPLVGVSANDALTYADWCTRQFGRGRWTFRLPTAGEWERAARGADRRFHPWGDRFDYAFLAHFRSRKREGKEGGEFHERLGLFPADESSFGVRDLLGPVAVWIPPLEPGFKIWDLKGGAFVELPRWSRIVSTLRRYPSETSPTIGIRLAADLPRED